MQNGKQNPFLGLKPYELKDRQKLYGRDKDLVLMKDRIFSARAILLFAGSGVGKTSFLNAKIIPELQPQYCVIYHKQWATDEPLVAITNSMKAQFARDDGSQARSADPTLNKSLLDHLDRFKKGSPDSATSGRPNRCLLILDQFEEIFQYHAYKKYFGTFIEELSAVINAADYNARVLFSMREEFLGELSVFDNNVPDLFNNYYRLKCPNKLEAEEIIERTCSLVDVPVDVERLKDLVSDLARIEKGEPVAVDPAKPDNSPKRAFLERDIVAPPYLQIACKGLWDSQFSSEHPQEKGFLAAYNTGDAHKMLELFCTERLSSLNDSERAILADAFDFLVTKKGAKIAYELSTLAEHMQVNEEVLKAVLLKLSQPDLLILRRSKGPDGSLWFELYHDMYGSIIEEWKRAYRLNEKVAFRHKVERAVSIIALVALLVVCYSAVHHWLIEPPKYEKLLGDAHLEDPTKYAQNLSAYTKLKDTLFFERKANELWAEAWKRRAHLAEKQEKGQEALLCWLTAAAEGPPEQEAGVLSEVANYLDNIDYRSLLASYQFADIGPPGVNRPIFSGDGKTLLRLSRDRRVSQLNTTSGEVKQSPPLQLEESEGTRPSTLPSQGGAQQTGGPTGQGQTSEAVIQAAAKNLVAGFDKDKLHIWNLNNGSSVWSSSSNDTKLKKAAKAGSAYYYNEASASASASASFSPDGQHFATLDPLGSAQVYTVKVSADQTVVETFGQPMPSVTQLKFSPDNHTLLLLLNNQTFQLKDLEKGALLTRKTQAAITTASFSPDGTKFLLGSGGSDRPQIWDTASASLIRQTDEFTGQGGAANFLADNKTLVFCELRQFQDSGLLHLRLRFLDSDTDAVLSARVTTFDHFRDYIINPDGKSILTIGDGIARLWDLNPLEPRGKIIKDSAKLLAAAMSSNGRSLATLNKNKEAKKWDTDNAIQTGKVVIAGGTPRSIQVRGPYDDYYDQPDLIVSSDCQYVCIRDSAGVLLVWEPVSGHLIPIADPGKGTIGPLAFSPNGQILATAAPDMVIRLWKNLGSQNPEPITLEQHEFVKKFLFSPDGKYLAAICGKDPCLSEFSLKIVDVASRNEIVLDKPGEKVNSNLLAFSGNGKLIAGGDDNAAFVWDLATGHYVKLPQPAAVTEVFLSLDGRVALTGCSDGSVQMWDVSGKKIGSAEKYGTKISSIAISSDGKTLIAISDQWIHLSSITDKGLEYRAGRLTNAMFGGIPGILDPAGQNFRHLLYASPYSLEVENISFFSHAVSATPTDSAKILLDNWEKKLSLKFDDRGQISNRENSR